MRFILLLFALGVALVGCGTGGDAVPPSLPADSSAAALADSLPPLAPDFTLNGLDGTPFTLADHRGEVVVVNFWATWCMPCLAEMPTLETLHRELDGVQIIGISQDAGGAAEIRLYADELGVTYPLLPDPAFNVASRFGGVSLLPTTFFVGPEGRLRQTEVGALTERKLRTIIGELARQEQTRARLLDSSSIVTLR